MRNIANRGEPNTRLNLHRPGLTPASGLRRAKVGFDGYSALSNLPRMNVVYEEIRMSEKNIVLIPGDGIGTEIIAAAKAVFDVAFDKAGVKVNWIDKKAGGASIDAYGVPLTEDTIEACKKADAVLLGAVGGPKWDNVDPSIRPEKAILGLRKELCRFCYRS